MRVLMLTDDASAIDRRILLEAEELIDLGHEVIVLARHENDLPASAIMGRVKVEYLRLFQHSAVKYNFKDVLFYFAKHKLKSNQRLRSVLLGVLSIIMAYRDDYKGYIGLQARRIFDPWIPLHRRAAILLKTISFQILFLVYFVFSLIFSALSGRKLFPNRRNIADDPFVPNAWDNVLINRGIFYDPDVVVSHDLPQLFAGAAIKKRLNIPLIYDAHEVYSEIGTLTASQKSYLRHREAKYIHNCNHVFTVNPFAAAWFEKTYDYKPVRTLTNATETPARFDYAKQYRLFHQALSLKPDVKVLCYQGWFSKEGRGLQELIAAMPKINRNVHLVMMGYGDHAFFQSLIDAAGVSSRVHLMNAVPWRELLWWSASADAGIIPYQPVDFNHQICSPNKLFEFIAARLPMVVNNLSYLTHVVEGEGFGIARKMETPEQIAEAVNEMFDPVVGRVVLAKKSLLAKGLAWEWHAQSREMVSIYQSIKSPQRPAYAGNKARLAIIPERVSNEVASFESVSQRIKARA